MRAQTFQSVIPNKMNERLVLVAINTQGKFTEEQRTQLRREAWKRIGIEASKPTVLHSEPNGRGETLAIFENYVVKALTRTQLFKYRLRKLFAAAISHIGINTVLVVVVNDANPLVVGTTTPTA